MGKSGAGKSSMRSIVFSNYIAKDVRRLGATIDVEHSNIRFMGNLVLNLWDCGGQDTFMESYLTSQHDGGAASGGAGGGAGSKAAGGTGGSGVGGRGQKEHVFRDAAVLIFVFDVESRNFPTDALNYGRVVRALAEHSPSARVFVLIHKMDLVQTHMRQRVFEERAAVIRAHSDRFAEPMPTVSPPKQKGIKSVTAASSTPSAASTTTTTTTTPSLSFFATSIWDQTLYRAWTSVIYSLVPNATALHNLLHNLTHALHAREVILYERTTCLTITSVSMGLERTANPFTDRLERLSAILKTQKHSLARHAKVPAGGGGGNFALMEIKTSRFMMFACRASENANLVVVMPPCEAAFNVAKRNVEGVRRRFEELDVTSGGTGGPGEPAQDKGKVRVSQEMFLSDAAKDVVPVDFAPQGRERESEDAPVNGERTKYDQKKIPLRKNDHIEGPVVSGSVQ